MRGTGSNSIHAAFRAHARRAPGARAVVAGDRTLTYGELDRDSDDIAAQLVASAGVRPGDCVPVVMGRSVELVVTLLAVLKAGVAYAVLDPSWTPSRLDAAVRHLGAELVLGVSWPGGPRAFTPAPPHGRPAPPDRAGLQDPASVFFTSGTTGEPKGALVPHAGAVLLFDRCDFMRLDETTVTLQAAALQWDALTLELWSVLTTGGSVRLIGDGVFLDGTELRAAVRDGVNTTWLTASVFAMLVDEDLDCFAGLRHVLTGGERMSVPHARRFLTRHPDIALTNGYGPVEATVFVTTHRVREADLDADLGVPLGTAVPSTELVVEVDGGSGDEGCVGELVVSGPRVGLGYVGRDDPAGFRLAGGTRAYATGDLVSRRDGLFYFHGRADRQFKLRGLRIEPGEIERVAAGHPDVGSCAVAPMRAAGSDTVEALALVHTGTCSPDVLRAHLRSVLPPQLVPSLVVAVERLPLNAHGKLNGAAVEALLAEHRDAQKSALTPAIPTDPAWAGFVALTHDLLRGAVPRPDDTWWGLGGSSLDLVKLAIRASATFGRDVPAHTLGSLATIGDMVAAIASAPADADADHGAAGTRPLTDTQAGFLLQHAMGEDDAALNAMVWRIEGDVDRTALGEALRDVETRHTALRSRYLLEPMPQTAPLAGPRVTLVGLDTCDGPEAGPALDRVLDALHEPLDLESGLVWRAVIAAGSSTSSVLGIGVHHVAFDGWSESLLARDLSLAYESRRHGRPPAWRTAPGTPREAPPADPGLTASWVRHLQGAVDITWRDRSATPCAGPCTTATHVAERLVPAEHAAVLRAWAAARGQSLFSVTLAAYTWALAEHSEHAAFLVGLPTRRRSTSEVDVIGCLIDVTCLRAPSGAGDWPAHVKAVAEELRWCLPRSTVSLRDVRQALSLPSNGRQRLYQVMFAYQDHPTTALEVGDRAAYTRVPPRRAPAELLLEIVPDDERGGLRLVASRQCEHVSCRLLDAVLDTMLARLPT
ncbi:MAG: AMP-binding protein [Nocardioides sp.]|nr:AMP-binding protein [Nocardioides sp.]MDE0777047.1 AMP-binding protein [Nocardioides sp.]